MEFLNSKKFIVLMLIVLLWTGLSACTPTNTEEINAEITKEMEAMDKEQESESGPTDFEGIADVLGCMFAPGNEECKKLQADRDPDKEDQEWDELEDNGDTK